MFDRPTFSSATSLILWIAIDAAPSRPLSERILEILLTRVGEFVALWKGTSYGKPFLWRHAARCSVRWTSRSIIPQFASTRKREGIFRFEIQSMSALTRSSPILLTFASTRKRQGIFRFEIQ